VEVNSGRDLGLLVRVAFVIVFVIILLVVFVFYSYVEHLLKKLIYEIGGDDLAGLVAIAGLIIFYLLRKRNSKEHQ
jgi:hypothetical protein